MSQRVLGSTACWLARLPCSILVQQPGPFPMPSLLLDTASQDVLRVAYLLIRMYAVSGFFGAFLILLSCCIQRHTFFVALPRIFSERNWR